MEFSLFVAKQTKTYLRKRLNEIQLKFLRLLSRHILPQGLLSVLLSWEWDENDFALPLQRNRPA